MDTMIELQNIMKVYERGAEKLHILNDLSLSVAKGDFVAIVGPSGSGKSTLMNMIGLLDVPTSGTYRLDGVATENMSDNELAELRNKKIGFIFQQFNLLPRLNALENVELPMIYSGLNKKARRERAQQMLELLGMGQRGHHKPSELSGGQQQRVAIARALSISPSLILADEPTGALDSKTVGTIKEKGSSISGVSLDNSVFVPLETARRAFKLGNIRTTYLEAPTKDDLSAAQSTITQYLTYKFKSNTGFQLINQDELMKARVEASSTLTNQLVAVACISLLVGGIGIMNIMLVTVSERTREIGIRKSIGAKRRNILVQFLIEATIISGLGGIIGLLLGSGLSLAWPMINPKQPTQLSLEIGLYAFLFSVGVGMIFGLYPANKASKLRPIDALRSD